MEEKFAILSKKLAITVGVVVFTIFAMFLYYWLFYKPQIEEEKVFYCGVSDSQFLNQSKQLGKSLFTNNCAACHNKNMKDNLTGPALEDWKTFIKSENDMWVFLKDKKSYFKTHKNKAHLKQIKQYGMDCVNFPNLTLDDVKNIISYINAIY